MRINYFFLVFILTTPCFSQIEYPPLSFKSTLVQQVGFTTFTVNYERPLQRGRELFGILVPYGQPWKTGAGFHNTIGFDKPVSANGKLIAPGVYHLVTIPDQNNWKVILTTDSLVFSKNKPYQPEYEVMRIDAAPKNIQTHYEALNIDIDVVNNNAQFTIAWGQYKYQFYT